MCLAFKRWINKMKGKKAQRIRREEQLWLWLGYVNVSRASPREMTGSQNLARVPDWISRNIRDIADPGREIVMKFENDTEYEYRFKPRTSNWSGHAFYIDIYRRPQHWRKLL